MLKISLLIVQSVWVRVTTIRLPQTRKNAFFAQKSPIFIYLNAKSSGQNPDCPSQNPDCPSQIQDCPSQIQTGGNPSMSTKCLSTNQRWLMWEFLIYSLGDSLWISRNSQFWRFSFPVILKIYKLCEQFHKLCQKCHN